MAEDERVTVTIHPSIGSWLAAMARASEQFASSMDDVTVAMGGTAAELRALSDLWSTEWFPGPTARRRTTMHAAYRAKTRRRNRRR